MHCPTCGARNDAEARFCVNCGLKLEKQEAMYGRPTAYTSYGDSPSYPKHIPNYLIPSILVTIFCCLPLGIAAIVFAAQVNGKVAAGDIVGARAASKTAKILVWVAIGIGIILLAVILLCGFGVETTLHVE